MSAAAYVGERIIRDPGISLIWYESAQLSNCLGRGGLAVSPARLASRISEARLQSAKVFQLSSQDRFHRALAVRKKLLRSHPIGGWRGRRCPNQGHGGLHPHPA